MPCPLCHHAAPDAIKADGLTYHDCPACGLIHLDPRHHPTPDAERAHYLTHENDPADPRYRAFLDRLAVPLADRLAPGARGLDYGSGPGPTLHLMLAERGFPTAHYDPAFHPDESALAPGPPFQGYDFITCSETAEHFHHPRREFDRLNALLRPAGWLAVMTTLFTDDDHPPPATDPLRGPGPADDPGRAFSRWWYRRDPTHVSFYRPRTLHWLAGHYGWSLHRPSETVALFRKGGG